MEEEARRIPLYCAYKADLLGEGENPVIEQALSAHAYPLDGDRLLAAAVFWIKRNLGEDAAKILSLSRLRLERAV